MYREGVIWTLGFPSPGAAFLQYTMQSLWEQCLDLRECRTLSGQHFVVGVEEEHFSWGVLQKIKERTLGIKF